MLSDREIRVCAWTLGQELARRRRYGQSVPAVLLDVHRALLAEVSHTRHDECETSRGQPQFETTTQRAQRLGVSRRTVARQAAKSGTPKVGRQYLFEKGST